MSYLQSMTSLYLLSLVLLNINLYAFSQFHRGQAGFLSMLMRHLQRLSWTTLRDIHRKLAMGGGLYWWGHIRFWKYLWASWRDPQLRCPQQPIGRIMMEPKDMVAWIHACLLSGTVDVILSCCPLTVRQEYLNILCRRWESKVGLFVSVLHCFQKLGTNFHLLYYSLEKNHRHEKLFLGEESVWLSEIVPSTLYVCIQYWIFFAPVICWYFFTGLFIVFCKS